MTLRTVRLGAGSGFAGDRIDPARDLAERGALDYLVFECLAERTIALAQLARLADPRQGHDSRVAERMRAVLPACAAQGVRIVANFGAANPPSAAAAVAETARALGLAGLRIAVVAGDDVSSVPDLADCALAETGARVADLGDRFVSANAYLGAAPIAEALALGADVVVTGRVADPALFLGPLMHAFGWAEDDWERLGRGVLAGHLLECAGQVTGGYFADPGLKDVPDLARLGFPIGVVEADGAVTITKLPGTGGQVTRATCAEQTLYEVEDPAAYLQPDVVADFSRVTLTEVGPDAVRADGASGRARPDALKVSVGYRDGFIGEGQISYAGPGAVARARLAGEIVRARLALTGVRTEELRIELIGVDALHGPRPEQAGREPWEARLRVAGRCADADEARRIGAEVEALYTNGPAGGGGAWAQARPVIAIASAFLPRAAVRPSVAVFAA